MNATIRFLWQCRWCRKMVESGLARCPYCNQPRRPTQARNHLKDKEAA